MSTSHEPAYAEDGKPKLRYQLYHEEKAKGGIALTMFGGSTNVAPDSPPIFGQLYVGDDDIIPYFRQLADRDARPRRGDHGPADPPRPAHRLGRRRLAADVSARPVREPAHRALPEGDRGADIRRVVARLRGGGAALQGGRSRRDRDSSAYGHLIDQFCRRRQPAQRIGTAGRSTTGCASRSRCSKRCAAGRRGLRRRHPDEPATRTCRGRAHRGGRGRDRGDGWPDSGLIDFINVVKGSIATDEARSHVDPATRARRSAVLQFAGGSANGRPADLPCRPDRGSADRALRTREGHVDLVGMIRAHMADPHIVRKLEAGEADRIRPCVGASYCINRIYVGMDALCIHNPATGREALIPHAHRRRAGRAGGSSSSARVRPGSKPRGSRPSAVTPSCCWKRRGEPAARSSWRLARRSGAGAARHRRLARGRGQAARRRPPPRHGADAADGRPSSRTSWWWRPVGYPLARG